MKLFRTLFIEKPRMFIIKKKKIQRFLEMELNKQKKILQKKHYDNKKKAILDLSLRYEDEIDKRDKIIKRLKKQHKIDQETLLSLEDKTIITNKAYRSFIPHINDIIGSSAKMKASKDEIEYNNYLLQKELPNAKKKMRINEMKA